MIEVEIEGKKVGFRFGVRAIESLSKSTGLSTIDAIITKLVEQDIPFRTKFLLACAVEYCRKNGMTVVYTEEDAFDWQDDLGLIETSKLIDSLLKVYSGIKNQEAPGTGRVQ